MSIYFFVLPSAPFAMRNFLESGFITKKVVQVSGNFQMIHLESGQDIWLSIKNKIVLLRVLTETNKNTCFFYLYYFRI